MTHKLILPIYYEDTDAAGVVYYANYLKFTERARTEILRQQGINQKDLLSSYDTAFVVRDVTAKYILPAQLDDEIYVQTSLQKLAAASINLEQNIFNNKSGDLLFESVVTIVCVNEQMKPIKIPDNIKSIFKQLD